VRLCNFDIVKYFFVSQASKSKLQDLFDRSALAVAHSFPLAIPAANT
jgi:hypothetical protein